MPLVSSALEALLEWLEPQNTWGKDVIGTGEHPLTAAKGPELKLGSLRQIRAFYSSVMWRNWEESPIRQSFTTKTPPIQISMVRNK